MARRSGLGRGLGALIPTDVASGDATVRAARAAGQPDRAQPAPAPRPLRRGVAGRPDRLGPRAGRAPADPGARGRGRPLRADRRRAALAGGQAGRAADIPAIVRDVERRRSLEQALVENLHRDDLNPLEEAAAYQQLIEDFGLTHEDVARRVGKSRSAVANTLRLFQLPPPSSGWSPTASSPPATPGRCSAPPTAPSRRRWPGASRREGLTCARSRRRSGPRGEAPAPTPPAPDEPPTPGSRLRPPGLLELEELLADQLDTRVKVTWARSGARVVIDFADLEDLERIYRAMTTGRRRDREPRPAAGSAPKRAAPKATSLTKVWKPCRPRFRPR